MNTSLKKLRLRQLEARAAPIRDLAKTPPPRAGWLRAVRQAFGMSTTQLAARLGMTRQGVTDLEGREADGTVTLAALRKAADALGCDLYHAVVPRRPMNDMMRERAREVATRNLARIAHSMRLEDQAVPDEEQRRQVEDLADQLLRDLPRHFWDEPTK